MMALDFAATSSFFFLISSLVLRMLLCEMLQMALQIGWISTCYVFHARPVVADRIHIDNDAFTIVTIYQVFEILPHTALSFGLPPAAAATFR